MELPSDKELFESTEADVTPEIVEAPAEQPVAEIEGQPRDDHGRFAPKAQDEPEPQPAPQAAQQQPARDEAHVPSWRVREIREEADRRLAEERANWERRFEMLQRQNQPRPEPVKPPDVWENPDAFVQHGVQQAVDPIKSEIGQLREFYSRRDAEREHGADKVQAAFDWIKQGMAQRDPEAVATYQRAMQSMHPFGELVTAHQQRTVYQQIGSDPQAWFGKTLDERLASDPKFAGELLQKLQQTARGGTAPQGQGQPLVHLPPSLRNAPAARASNDDGDGDISNDALWAHANR